MGENILNKSDTDEEIQSIKDKMNNSIIYNPIFRRIIYVACILSSIICAVGKISNESKNPSFNAYEVFVVLLVLFVIDFFLYRMNYFMSTKVFLVFRFCEILLFELIIAVIANINVLVMPLSAMIFLWETEYILYGSDFMKDNIFTRRIVIAILAIFSSALGANYREEVIWTCFIVLHIVIVCGVYAIVNMIVEINDRNEKRIFKLSNEVADIQDANEKLIEYQEKIETINEEINYQRIEMKRTNNELEQVNKEVEAQAEVMKYMSSTFSVQKCVDVLTDSIIEMRQPKLCAIYTAPDDFIDKYGNITIKTNYTSIERRLKEDSKDIFKLAKDNKTTRIYVKDKLEQFGFIGKANINSVALFPLTEEEATYGFMIVASDREDFFDKGIAYYEGCIAEFNISVKNTRLYLMMQDMAHKDGLTHINNRMYFMQLFEATVNKAKKEKTPVSVALYDIDKFKSVNDTYGHLAGDEVIKMVASIGDKYAEVNDGYVGRYGGEEFLIVFPDKDKNQALSILEAMHEEIKNTVVKYEEYNINVNVCIGLTAYPEICDEPSLLINRADMAMYYGKEHGRGRLVIDSPEIAQED